MSDLGDLQLVQLDQEHADGGLALSAEAGWNQTKGDWRFMLAYGRGWGFYDRQGRLVASALVLPQSASHAWISMVLVTAAWRRRGLATKLMRHCLDHCERAGLTAWLDATPAGAEVYKRLGFVPVMGLERMRASSPTLATVPSTVRPMRAQDLPQVAELDHEASGADRSRILAWLFERAPSSAYIQEDGQGFILGRDGRTALQLGPLVARHVQAALALLDMALASADGPVLVDAVGAQDAFPHALADRGFARERPFLRMARGATLETRSPARLMAVAGPELG